MDSIPLQFQAEFEALFEKQCGVFLVNVLERKYPHAATNFVRQWLFPAFHLTRVPETSVGRHISQDVGIILLA